MTPIIHSHPVWLPQTQTWMYNQVRFLPARYECHIVCEHTENLDQFGVARIHAVRDTSQLRYRYDQALMRFRLRRHSGWLAEQIRATGAALVHSHFGHVAWRDMWACRKAGMPQVVTFYGLDVNLVPTLYPKWRRRYAELFDSAAQILCEGPHMAACIAALGCPQHKIIVHHLGVALDELPFRPRQYDPPGPLRVLIAGSFREKKGIPDAIAALGRLDANRKLEITIIGGVDGTPASDDEKRSILRAIETNELTSKTRMLGYQPHARLIAEALDHHIFLSPSVTARNGDTEGGAPVSIIETAATGMPVIATRHCDIPEVVIDGATGFLADEHDIDGLAACLERLIGQPEQWCDIAQKARRHVEASFDCQRQGETLGEIYQGVLAER